MNCKVQKYRVLVMGLLILSLMGLSGCGRQESTANVPKLKDPVGVDVDTAKVKKMNLSSVNSYSGEVVPDMVGVYFANSGQAGAVKVEIGDKIKKGQLLATLTGSDYTTYYMSTSHLYLANTIYEQFLWDSSTKTAISKFEYKGGAFSYQTTKKVKGQINDSYYMHEYKGNFAFVYTDWRNETSTNGICILDKNMNTLGKIDNLGNDETIYASYYIGSMAYFVTYRQTDPVFAVDISNPKKPVVKAKLKLPGFSSYLHSFGENQLIGVGMADGDDDKVKISLFALGENGSVTEQTKLLLPKYSETEAGSNHKSVFIDEERKLVGFATIADTTLRYKLYHFDGTGFKQVLNVPIKEMSNTRGIRIGNYFYVVDNAKKIHAYDMQTWK